MKSSFSAIQASYGCRSSQLFRFEIRCAVSLLLNALGKHRYGGVEERVSKVQFGSAMNVKVAIIILNWNGWEDTAECLESLFRIDYVDYDVIVVDNASEDDSIQKIRDYCDDNLRVKSNFISASDKQRPIDLIEYWRDTTLGRELQKETSSEHRRLILVKNEKN